MLSLRWAKSTRPTRNRECGPRHAHPAARHQRERREITVTTRASASASGGEGRWLRSDRHHSRGAGEEGRSRPRDFATGARQQINRGCSSAIKCGASTRSHLARRAARGRGGRAAAYLDRVLQWPRTPRVGGQSRFALASVAPRSPAASPTGRQARLGAEKGDRRLLDHRPSVGQLRST